MHSLGAAFGADDAQGCQVHSFGVESGGHYPPWCQVHRLGAAVGVDDAQRCQVHGVEAEIRDYDA
ncbi:MAG: hypothetical protein WBG76_00555, partial [Ornithinimicrobium sp.]